MQRRAVAADESGMTISGLRIYHLVAKLDRTDVSLCEFDVGCWFWERLRAAFPLALGACSMPDHPHLLTPLTDPEAGRQRLNRLLGQLARRVGVRCLGETAPPAPIVDRPKLLRHLRYIGLNAPRDGLTDDPLAWLFSTHRDVVGATVDPWVDARQLAHVLGRNPIGFAAWYHAYVSGDRSVDVAGTAMPRPALPTELTRVPLMRIAIATAACLRVRPEAIRETGLARRIFVGLAREQGWRSTGLLAKACACSTSTIQRIADVDLAPARLCLGDARLLRGVPRWRGSPPEAAGKDRKSAA